MGRRLPHEVTKLMSNGESLSIPGYTTLGNGNNRNTV